MDDQKSQKSPGGSQKQDQNEAGRDSDARSPLDNLDQNDDQSEKGINQGNRGGQPNRRGDQAPNPADDSHDQNG